MTQSNVGYIIVGLAILSAARARRIATQLSALIIGGEVNAFFSGDHHEMMVLSALHADLYEAAGFEIKPVLI